jgi:hypothetical protein
VPGSRQEWPSQEAGWYAVNGRDRKCEREEQHFQLPQALCERGAPKSSILQYSFRLHPSVFDLVKHERPTRIVHRLMPKATIEAEDISARTTGRERSMQELVAMNIMLKGRRAYVWIVCEDAEQANALTHQ